MALFHHYDTATVRNQHQLQRVKLQNGLQQLVIIYNLKRNLKPNLNNFVSHFGSPFRRLNSH